MTHVHQPIISEFIGP